MTFFQRPCVQLNKSLAKYAKIDVHGSDLCKYLVVQRTWPLMGLKTLSSERKKKPRNSCLTNRDKWGDCVFNPVLPPVPMRFLYIYARTPIIDVRFECFKRPIKLHKGIKTNLVLSTGYTIHLESNAKRRMHLNSSNYHMARLAEN